LLETLAAFYERTGSWDGVAEVFADFDGSRGSGRGAGGAGRGGPPLLLAGVNEVIIYQERGLHAGDTLTGGGCVTVSASVEKRWTQIAVADTGEGIPADELPFVFDRFYRGDKSRARARGGSGLGLAIAKTWVEALGGETGVESEPGRGSRFWCTVPAVR